MLPDITVMQALFDIGLALGIILMLKHWVAGNNSVQKRYLTQMQYDGMEPLPKYNLPPQDKI